MVSLFKPRKGLVVSSFRFNGNRFVLCDKDKVITAWYDIKTAQQSFTELYKQKIKTDGFGEAFVHFTHYQFGLHIIDSIEDLEPDIIATAQHYACEIEIGTCCGVLCDGENIDSWLKDGIKVLFPVEYAKKVLKKSLKNG